MPDEDEFALLKLRKKASRQRAVSCEGECQFKYGTPTKVVPGKKCRNCGWEAPSDGMTAAEHFEKWLEENGK